MTRELHSQTEVQRAESSGHAPPEARERGYEPRDAPAGKVALGAGALFSLMLIGLLVAGLLLSYLQSQSRAPAPPFAEMRQIPPAPRLLDRGTPPLEAPLHRPSVQGSVSPAVESAMRQVEQAGWGEDLPPPPAQQVARDHRGVEP